MPLFSKRLEMCTDTLINSFGLETNTVTPVQSQANKM